MQHFGLRLGAAPQAFLRRLFSFPPMLMSGLVFVTVVPHRAASTIPTYGGI
jgi:hypothetical protein